MNTLIETDISQEEFYSYMNTADWVGPEECIESHFGGPHSFQFSFIKNGVKRWLLWGWGRNEKDPSECYYALKRMSGI